MSSDYFENLNRRHEEFVSNLQNKTPLVLHDKTEVWTYLYNGTDLYKIHLTYVYCCPRRHELECEVEGIDFHVTGIFWLVDDHHAPIEISDFDKLVEVSNGFIKQKFGLENFYNKYDFGYEDEEVDEYEGDDDERFYG